MKFHNVRNRNLIVTIPFDATCCRFECGGNLGSSIALTQKYKFVSVKRISKISYERG
jgi:hypothetical protein